MTDDTRTTYHLIDVEALHRLHPDEVWLPETDARGDLDEGEFAKLIFEVIDPTEAGPSAERMWVEIRRRGGGRYEGTLANRPSYPVGVELGEQVTFGPEHVVDVYAPTDTIGGWVSRLLAIASARVLDGGERPRALWRAEPVDVRDSGWQLLAGDEGDAYLEQPGNASLVPVAALLERFPELAEVIEAPMGSAFRWDPDAERYVAMASPNRDV